GSRDVIEDPPASVAGSGGRARDRRRIRAPRRAQHGSGGGARGGDHHRTADGDHLLVLPVHHLVLPACDRGADRVAPARTGERPSALQRQVAGPTARGPAGLTGPIQPSQIATPRRPTKTPRTCTGARGVSSFGTSSALFFPNPFSRTLARDVLVAPERLGRPRLRSRGTPPGAFPGAV